MSRIEKLIEKFYKKPIPNDITYQELISIAKHYGCRVKNGGSSKRHALHIMHPSKSRGFPVPIHGKCVQEIYVKQLKDLIEEIQEDV